MIFVSPDAVTRAMNGPACWAMRIIRRRAFLKASACSTRQICRRKRKHSYAGRDVRLSLQWVLANLLVLGEHDPLRSMFVQRCQPSDIVAARRKMFVVKDDFMPGRA